MRRLLLLFNATVLGCQPADRATARVTPPKSAEAPSVQTEPGPELLAGLWTFPRTFGENRAGLRQQLGAPLAVHVEVEISPYSATPDSIFRIEYSGLRVSVLRAGYDGREFVGDVTLSHPHRMLPGGFRIGHTSRAAVLGRLGTPWEANSLGDTLVLYYVAPDPVDEEGLEFTFIGDLLQKVRWKYPVD